MEHVATLRSVGEGGNVEVRLRHVMEADATAVLGQFPLADLQRVIDRLDQWGIAVDGGAVEIDLTGQFVLGSGEAYFEIIVDSDSAE